VGNGKCDRQSTMVRFANTISSGKVSVFISSKSSRLPTANRYGLCYGWSWNLSYSRITLESELALLSRNGVELEFPQVPELDRCVSPLLVGIGVGVGAGNRREPQGIGNRSWNWEPGVNRLEPVSELVSESELGAEPGAGNRESELSRELESESESGAPTLVLESEPELGIGAGSRSRPERELERGSWSRNRRRRRPESAWSLELESGAGIWSRN
jgi:hypothetical protein